MNIKLKRKFSFLLFLIFGFLIFGNTQKVYADIYNGHDSYFLDVYLDGPELRYGYEVKDDINFVGKSMEEKTNMKWFGYFKKTGIMDKSPIPKSIAELSETDYNLDIDMEQKDKEKLMYTFPAAKSKIKADRNGYDYQRASDVGNILTDSLNNVISTIDIIDGEFDIDTPAKLAEASLLLSPGGQVVAGFSLATIDNYCHILYGTDIDNPKAYENGSFYGYIIPFNIKPSDLNESNINGILLDSRSFVWAVEKGYMEYGSLKDGSFGAIPRDRASLDNNTSSKGLSATKLGDNGDAIWISMFNIADTANYKFYKTYNGEYTAPEEDENFVEALLGGIFRRIILGLQNILGLDSIYDLVYNGSSIGTGKHENGMMNPVWWSIMLKYHLIFQVVAWMVIGLAVAKILIELNFSTINPKLRMSIMEMFQNLFVVGFMLVLTIPIMKLLTSVNNDIVSIFKTQAQTDAEAFTVGNSIAQLFAYAGYFGILISLNCVYIMRSIMLAILGAAAPLFIVSMAFSKGQGLFSQWLKEVVANIFVQSVHAFTLAFLFEVLNRGGMLEQLVILFSLMPITDTFRGWIFGNAGSFASSTGQKLGGAIGSTVKGVAKGAAGGVINTASDRMKLRHGLDSESQGGKSGSKTGGKSGAGEGALAGASSAMASRGAQLAQGGDKNKGSSKAMANMGKAVGAGANALSSFESMGDMMNQANSGDYGGMASSGQQLAQNVGAASAAVSDVGATALGKAGAATSAVAKNVGSKIDKRYDVSGKVNNAKSAINNNAGVQKMKAIGSNISGKKNLAGQRVAKAMNSSGVSDALKQYENKRLGLEQNFNNLSGETCMKVSSSDIMHNQDGTTSFSPELLARKPELKDHGGGPLQMSADGKTATVNLTRNHMEAVRYGNRNNNSPAPPPAANENKKQIVDVNGTPIKQEN